MLHTLLYFLALICLSTSPVWARLNNMPAELLGFYRLALASLVITLFGIYKKKSFRQALSRANIWVFISALFFFLHLWSYKYGAKHIPISHLMILFATNPIWASIGATLFFGEKINLRLIIAYLLAFASIFILVKNDLNSSTSVTTDNIKSYGDLIALLSAFFYAVYMLTGKKARQKMPNQDYALFQYFTAALLFLAASVYTSGNLSLQFSTTSWAAVIGLVVFSTFLGHYLLTYLVQYMDISLLTCGKLIEPVLASIWAYFIFQETLQPMAIISFCLTSVAIIILFWPQLYKLMTTSVLKIRQNEV